MKSAVPVVLLALALAACDEPTPERINWPPAPGTVFVACGTFPAVDGAACSDVGWCSECYTLQGCYCDGAEYTCFAADSVCDFGEGAGCPVEGTPQCGIAPAPGYATCTAGHVEYTYTCPLDACPDYDPATDSCTCADGTCP